MADGAATAIGLVQAGLQLAKYVKQRYDAYHDAPVLLLDLMREVDFTVSWVMVVVRHLAQPDGIHNEKFTQDADDFGYQTQRIFDEIHVLLPHNPHIKHGKWTYMIHEKHLHAAMQRLRTIQFHFQFMCIMYAQVQASSNPGGAKAKDLGNGAQALGGLHGPLKLNGFDAAGREYHVKMTVSAAPEIVPTLRIQSRARGRLREVEDDELARLERERLRGLVQSPLFEGMSSREFGAPTIRRARQSRHNGSAEEIELRVRKGRVETRYRTNHGKAFEMVEPVSAQNAERKVEELEERWFGRSDSDERDRVHPV